MRRSLGLILALLLLAVPVAAESGSPANAARAETGESGQLAPLTPEQGQRARAIERNTMSPFCPGRTLSDCPSPNAADWRREIEGWVRQGLSTDEIRARLEKRVGGDLSGSPSSPLGSALPVLLGVFAVGLLALVLNRFRSKALAEGDAESAVGKASPERADSDEAPRSSSSRPAGSREAELEDRLRRELEEL